MRLVRDQPFVRLFPSRRRFALAKLIAFAALRFQCSRNSEEPELQLSVDPGQPVLAIDSDQDTIEIYFAGILHTTVCTSFLAAHLPLAAPLSVLVAALIEPPLVLLCCFVTGGLVMPRWTALRKRNTVDFRRANGSVLMALAAAASIWMVRQSGLLFTIGAIFLTIGVLNASASIAVRILHRTMVAWEQRCVA